MGWMGPCRISRSSSNTLETLFWKTRALVYPHKKKNHTSSCRKTEASGLRLFATRSVRPRTSRVAKRLLLLECGKFFCVKPIFSNFPIDRRTIDSFGAFAVPNNCTEFPCSQRVIFTTPVVSFHNKIFTWVTTQTIYKTYKVTYQFETTIITDKENNETNAVNKKKKRK